MSPATAHQLVTTDELHNHCVEQQQQSSSFMEDPSLFSTSNPQQHQNQFHQHQVVYGDSGRHPFISSLNFKLGLNENSSSTTVHGGLSNLVLPEERPSSLLLPNSWHTQQLSHEPIKEPFWEPLNRCNELEAIYSLPIAPDQAGSGSALTGETTSPSSNVVANNVTTSVPNVDPIKEVDHGSDQPRKKRKEMKDQLGYVVGFFERLMKQVMDHQEGLHKKLLMAIERTDKERTEREEAWRSQETEKRTREALSRAQYQAMASSREARVVRYLEKITGQIVDLPAPPQPSIKQAAEISNCRWPEGEVEALIGARVRLEHKFQEPGVKGPLWEEVSSAMASMGYRRSAKRCKEKWENINKYFRKKKDSANANTNAKPKKKKSSQPSKTCPYFDQLDQLYSKTSHGLNNDDPLPGLDEVQQRGGYTELLAYIVAQNPNTTNNLNACQKEPSSTVFEANEDPNSKVEIEERSESRAQHDQ